jgi:hypothetical protein
MKTKLPLPLDQKLHVLCRVEPGCLGPKGVDHIEEFCAFAEKELESIDSDFVHWEIVPRHNKKEAEMQYKVNNKNLSHDKAANYLELFKKDLDEFEEHLHEKLSYLVDHYWDNK